MQRNCHVTGIGTDGIRESEGIFIHGSVNFFDRQQVMDFIAKSSPDVIFFLAAHHNSSEDELEQPGILIDKTYAVAKDMLVHFLEAIRVTTPNCRLVFAASSHIFMESLVFPQTENTPFAPNSVYGYAKLNGLYLVRHYRQQVGLKVSTAILYNHESEFRSEKFISAKLMHAALRIKKGQQGKIEIGNFCAQTDWGYAYDYCNAMIKIAEAEAAGEFIVSTGILHTVADFAQEAFAYVGLDYREYVIEKSIPVRNSTSRLQGDSTRLRSTTGWAPSVNFAGMIASIMKEIDHNGEK